MIIRKRFELKLESKDRLRTDFANLDVPLEWNRVLLCSDDLKLSVRNLVKLGDESLLEAIIFKGYFNYWELQHTINKTSLWPHSNFTLQKFQFLELNSSCITIKMMQKFAENPVEAEKLRILCHSKSKPNTGHNAGNLESCDWKGGYSFCPSHFPFYFFRTLNWTFFKNFEAALHQNRGCLC